MKEMNGKDVALFLRHGTLSGNISGLARATLIAHSNKNSLSTPKGIPRREPFSTLRFGSTSKD